VQYFNFYDGEWRCPGRPGFYRGRYNGGSIGLCWTQIPDRIGVDAGQGWVGTERCSYRQI